MKEERVAPLKGVTIGLNNYLRVERNNRSLLILRLVDFFRSRAGLGWTSVLGVKAEYGKSIHSSNAHDS